MQCDRLMEPLPRLMQTIRAGANTQAILTTLIWHYFNYSQIWEKFDSSSPLMLSWCLSVFFLLWLKCIWTNIIFLFLFIVYWYRLDWLHEIIYVLRVNKHNYGAQLPRSFGDDCCIVDLVRAASRFEWNRKIYPRKKTKQFCISWDSLSLRSHSSKYTFSFFRNWKLNN